MRASRIAAITVLVAAFLAAPEPAPATLNTTGRWLLVFKSSDSPPEIANLVQTGTSLTVTLPTETLTGTFDPTALAFGVSDNRPCDPLSGTGPTTLSGTENNDGVNFSALYTQSVGSMCNPVVTRVEGLWAPADTCPDQTIHDWVWTKYDCIRAKSNRAFRRCFRAGVQQLAATLNAPDECIRELGNPRSERSRCGRPKAVTFGAGPCGCLDD